MILVTGGTGLIGSQIVFDLINSGESVRMLRRNESSLQNIKRLFGEKLPNTLSFADGELNDGYSIEQALEGVETVYHCAAFISFHKSEREKMMHVNVEGTANMVNLAL